MHSRLVCQDNNVCLVFIGEEEDEQITFRCTCKAAPGFARVCLTSEYKEFCDNLCLDIQLDWDHQILCFCWVLTKWVCSKVVFNFPVCFIGWSAIPNFYKVISSHMRESKYCPTWKNPNIVLTVWYILCLFIPEEVKYRQWWKYFNSCPQLNSCWFTVNW